MYDATKVIIGLALFLGAVTAPFWLSLGDDEPLPKPVVMEGPTECVESVAYMRANHMKLLDTWRDTVVREGERTWINSQGKTFLISLTKTCLNCHQNKEQFCEQCHKQVSVEPYCWQCHLVPGKDIAGMSLSVPGTVTLADPPGRSRGTSTAPPIPNRPPSVSMMTPTHAPVK